MAASLLALGACALASAAAAQEQPRPPVAVPPVTPPPVLKEDRLATSPPSRPSVITNPRWVRQPMTEFPERAMARGIEYGRARLECVVSVESRLTDCRVLMEDPPGTGFAQAALAGVPSAIVEPRTVDGVPVASRVTFNVDFRLAPEPVEPSAPKP